MKRSELPDGWTGEVLVYARGRLTVYEQRHFGMIVYRAPEDEWPGWWLLCIQGEDCGQLFKTARKAIEEGQSRLRWTCARCGGTTVAEEKPYDVIELLALKVIHECV